MSEDDLLVLTKPSAGLETLVGDVYGVVSKLSFPRTIAFRVKNCSEEVVGEFAIVLVMLGRKYTYDAVGFVWRCAGDVCEAQFLDVGYGLGQKLGIAWDYKGLSVICYRPAFYFFDGAMVRL